MALNPVGGAGPANIAGAATTPKVGGGGEKFGKVFDQATRGAQKPAGTPQPLPAQATAQAQRTHQAVAGTTRAQGVNAARATTPAQAVASAKPSLAVQTVDRVAAAQSKMDQILKLAESGKSFSPAELLALQTQAYRASQEIDLAGKVVEKATGGLKQILQTQV